MHIEEELKAFKERLDPNIGTYFDARIKEVEREDAFIADALRHARKIMLAGGKRLRAAFMYYGYLGTGGTEEQKILEASMSIEYTHAFLLVHDDIMDQDDLRHGIVTLHQRYTDFCDQLFPTKDARHFGNSIALIVGDMLCALGNDIIFTSGFSLEQKFQALSKLQNITLFTVVGQARDIYMEFKGEASEDEILAMYRNKTAKYTVEGPLHLGALLAGASQEMLDGLSAYAIPLGIAFQIQDDILGIFGDAKRLGKPVGSDIHEGKLTLLVSRALRNGTQEQRQRVKEILSLGDALRDADIEEFRTLIKTTGAFDEARQLAAQYIQEGIQALRKMQSSLRPRAYDFLSSVADYMMKREY